jgi:hypothetical protein
MIFGGEQYQYCTVHPTDSTHTDSTRTDSTRTDSTRTDSTRTDSTRTDSTRTVQSGTELVLKSVVRPRKRLLSNPLQPLRLELRVSMRVSVALFGPARRLLERFELLKLFKLFELFELFESFALIERFDRFELFELFEALPRPLLGPGLAQLHAILT